MNVDLTEEPLASVTEYAAIPISFDVQQRLDPRALAGTPGRYAMSIEDVQPPFVKDYDAIPGNQPSDWVRNAGLTDWTLLAARANGARVGGAAVARASGPARAVLWDIRVAPALRRTGIGTAVLGAAEALAQRHGLQWLEVETQNVNVPAYRFYLRHGFTLTHVEPRAYPALPDEVRLVLHKKLPGPHAMPDSITTPRLQLRRWRPSDAASLKAAIDGNLAHLQAWMPWAMAEPSALDVIVERITKFAKQFDAGLEWLYAIRSRESDEVLGGAGVHPRLGPGGLELGYWLAAAATGKGFATEASAALTAVALRQPGVERVQIRCDPKNSRSAGVPMRLGYRHVLTIENETFGPAGSLRDTMVWETTD